MATQTKTTTATLVVLLGAALAVTSEARAQANNTAAKTAAAQESGLLKRGAFYDPPADVPKKPGMLIRSEPLTDRTLPKNVRGWRALYTTEIAKGHPTVSGGVILAPANPPAGPRPVLLFEHGTIGTAQRCQPSFQ